MNSTPTYPQAKHIRLGEAVSFLDMAEWDKASTQPIVFELTKQSAFSMLVEGQAIAKLSDLKNRGIPFSVTFPFATCQELLHQPPRLLGGLFGLSLIAAAESVRDAQGTETKPELHSKLWYWTRARGGKIGKGHRTSIVFRDPDYLIPSCLNFGGNDPFPLPKNFTNVLTTVGQDLSGSRFGNTLAEATALGFLHEAAKNAHEHARYDAQRKPVSGVRGIVAEKQVFLNKEDLAHRKQISEPIRSYLQKLWPPRGREHTAVAITVADIGAGIHNTLAPQNDESPWARLNRAFELGVSRKPPGSGPNRGVGLTQILKAASKLRAFLFVRSGELAGFKDFGERLSVKNLEHHFSLDKWPEKITVDRGTSVSLVWSPKVAMLEAFPSLSASEDFSRAFIARDDRL